MKVCSSQSKFKTFSFVSVFPTTDIFLIVIVLPPNNKFSLCMFFGLLKEKCSKQMVSRRKNWFFQRRKLQKDSKMLFYPILQQFQKPLPIFIKMPALSEGIFFLKNTNFLSYKFLEKSVSFADLFAILFYDTPFAKKIKRQIPLFQLLNFLAGNTTSKSPDSETLLQKKELGEKSEQCLELFPDKLHKTAKIMFCILM